MNQADALREIEIFLESVYRTLLPDRDAVIIAVTEYASGARYLAWRFDALDSRGRTLALGYDETQALGRIVWMAERRLRRRRLHLAALTPITLEE